MEKKELAIWITVTIILMTIGTCLVGWPVIAIIFGVCYIGRRGGAGHYDAAMESASLGLKNRMNQDE